MSSSTVSTRPRTTVSLRSSTISVMPSSAWTNMSRLRAARGVRSRGALISGDKSSTVRTARFHCTRASREGAIETAPPVSKT